MSLLPRIPRKFGLSLLLFKCPDLDTELTLPIRIKPPLLSLALKPCPAHGFNLLLHLLYHASSNLHFLLPEPTVTSCLFSGTWKALNKWLWIQRNKEDICPTIPGLDGVSLLQKPLRLHFPALLRSPSLHYNLVINTLPCYRISQLFLVLWS